MYSMGPEPPGESPISVSGFWLQTSWHQWHRSVWNFACWYTCVACMSSPLLGPVAPPPGESIINTHMLYYWAFLHHYLWQTPDCSGVVERHLCITCHWSTQSAACHASVDGILLTPVTDQMFVNNHDFYTPPALLPSLEKGATVLHISVNCPPLYGGFVSCWHTCF